MSITTAPASDRATTNADNFSDTAGMFAGEIETFLEDAATLAKAEVTPSNQAKYADLIKREVALRGAAEKIKDSEKKPFLDACAEIQGVFNARVAQLKEALTAPKKKLEAYLQKLDDEREAEAKRAREEAARKQAEADALAAAAAETADPFERFDAAQRAEAAEIEAAVATRDAAAVPEKVKVIGVSTGRSVSLKTKQSVEIVDYAAALAHVSNDVRVKEAVQKAVDALAKAQQFGQTIPGCKFITSKAL